MRVSKSFLLATSIAVAAIAIMIPVSLVPSVGGTFFQTATGAASGTVTVTVTLGVRIFGNAGVAGATLTYGTPDTTVTADGSGDFSFVVPYGWSGTLTPAKTGYTFDPDHLDFSSVTPLSCAAGNDFNATDVEQDLDTGIPEEYTLGQNYPNPFNPSTVIPFALPRPGFVSLKVYNIIGQEVANLVANNLPAGAFRAAWNGTDMNGGTVTSGVYFYRLKAGDYAETRKMLLMK